MQFVTDPDALETCRKKIAIINAYLSKTYPAQKWYVEDCSPLGTISVRPVDAAGDPLGGYSEVLHFGNMVNDKNELTVEGIECLRAMTDGFMHQADASYPRLNGRELEGILGGDGYDGEMDVLLANDVLGLTARHFEMDDHDWTFVFKDQCHLLQAMVMVGYYIRRYHAKHRCKSPLGIVPLN